MADISQMAGNTQLAASMGGAAVQGGFGILGSLINYGLNKKLAAQQNQYNIDMWKMQADYNSPQAQMQRFQEAGLNPNLIYGQGSNGNMSQAPQMVTPQSPDFSKHMSELGKAFNIENLKTVVANRKKAEAEAKNADVNATRNSYELNAEINFGSKYTYDYNTGKYVLRSPNPDGSIDIINPSAYYFNRLLEGNYNRASLIPFRAAYLEGQKNYLAPQIEMLKYQQSYYPYTFWIGNGTKVLNSLTSIPATFSPLKWVPRPGNVFNRNIYYQP